MKRKSIILITAFVLLAAVIAAAAQLYSSKQAQEAAQIAAQRKQTLNRFSSPAIGNPQAPVHIVEFLDPACGTCAQFYPLVKKMLADNPQDIRLTVRYAPFHQGSEPVVRLLEASRKQGKFWQTLEALLGSQPAWVINHHANLDLVWAQLSGVGLDLERLKAEMQSPEVARVVAQDMQDANTMEVTATPEYFVNGRPLPSFGAQQLVALVQEELAKARQPK